MNNFIFFFGLFLLLICFFKYVNINSLIKKTIFLLSPIENFSNKFVPNRIFKYNDEIYLLDTRQLLVRDKNPMIFKTFKEYQKFISDIKNYIEKDFEYIKQFQEKDIKNLPFKFKNKSSEFDVFGKENKCNKFASKCDYLNNIPLLGEKPTLMEDRLNDLNNSEKECNKKLIDNKTCRKMERLYGKDRKYKKMCEKYPDKKKCKQLNFIKNNLKLLEIACVNKTKNFNNYKNICLLEDFFKENMLLYDF